MVRQGSALVGFFIIGWLLRLPGYALFPPLNCTVFKTPASLTSSMAMLMPPLPSATKLPVLAINAPGLALASVPLIEKAYVPLRLAFEKFPVGGGGVGKEEPLPPQAAANEASTTVRTSTSCFTITGRAPVRFTSVSHRALETPEPMNRVIFPSPP